MLAIRMQRTGRKGNAQFRLIVQDSRRTPTSGRLVDSLGHYNPHTKIAVLEKAKIEKYLINGAQPSEKVVRLLEIEGLKLPSWVAEKAKKTRTIKNIDKLRKNKPVSVKETPEVVTEEINETPDPIAKSETPENSTE